MRPGASTTLGAEPLAAEAGVLFGLGAPQHVVHVQAFDPVPERLERMPEARGVWTARDEAENVAAGRDQVMPADVLLDASPERPGIHSAIVGPLRLG